LNKGCQYPEKFKGSSKSTKGINLSPEDFKGRGQLLQILNREKVEKEKKQAFVGSERR